MKKLLIFILIPLLTSCANLVKVSELNDEVNSTRLEYFSIKDFVISKLNIFTTEELNDLIIFDGYVESIIDELDKVDVSEIDINKLSELWKLSRNSYIKIRPIYIKYFDKFDQDRRQSLLAFDLKLIKIDSMLDEAIVDKVEVLKSILDVVIFSLKIAKYLALV